jgi:N utilization substance protein B
MKRRNAREYALQFLYQLDFLEMGASEQAVQDAIDSFWVGVADKDPEVRTFAKDLIVGTIGNLSPIDREIQRAADKWDISRMASVDRTILRIGAYELLYRPDIPAAVSINEAIEIAKKYSTAESASFINGLLDRIARDVGRQQRKKPS